MAVERGRKSSLVIAQILVAIFAATWMAAPAAGLAPRSPDVTVLVSQAASAGQSVERAVDGLGGTVIRHLAVIDGFAARLPRTAVPALSRVRGVQWVSPNRALQLEGQYGQDSGVASAAYTDVVRASKTWGNGVTGNGVTVAIVDTGVNTAGDLAGQVVHAEDFTPEQNNADSYGHGTFVAGLIDGTGAGSGGSVKGVAPAAKIVSIKIAGADGTTDVVKVLAALEWIVDFKDVYDIRVVNLSLGFDASQPYHVDPLDFAVERVWNDGIVVVTAAGNGNNVPGSITSPGNDPRVITVGSSNDRTTVTLTDDKLASFSSVGPTVDGFTKPDVLAPGRSVVSSRSPGSTIDTTYPDSAIGTQYAKGSGTSFSSAIVTGVAALVLQRAPMLSPDQVKNRIITTTRDIGGATNQSWWPGDVDAFGAAMSLSILPANLGVLPAQGGGSLQLLRGVYCLRSDDGACMTESDANTAIGFDPAQYFSDTWAGSLWLGSQWLASTGTGSGMTGSQWAGSQWAGSQWAGSQWAGSQWSGSQWAGSQWAGAPWASDAWGYIP